MKAQSFWRDFRGAHQFQEDCEGIHEWVRIEADGSAEINTYDADFTLICSEQSARVWNYRRDEGPSDASGLTAMGRAEVGAAPVPGRMP